MEKHEIFIDLSKCTQVQIDWIMSVIPKTFNNYEIDSFTRHLIFFNLFNEWAVINWQGEYRVEVTFDQFKKLCAEWGYIDTLPKPLTELESVYINLSLLTRSELKSIHRWFLRQSHDNFNYSSLFKTLHFDKNKSKWVVSSEMFAEVNGKREVSFSQFSAICEKENNPILPKKITELEKECLNFLEKISSFHDIKVELESYCFNDNDTYLNKAIDLITKLKNHENI